MVDEELNVKRVNWVPSETVEVVLDTAMTPELKREGLVRDVIRFVQNARKDAGCNVEDHIKLALLTDDEELAAAIAEFKETIETETLSEYLLEGESNYTTNVKVEGVSMAIGITR
jgi:isoleucyl-tRNA synthetase